MLSSPITLIFIAANVVLSLVAFNNRELFDRFKFNVRSIQQGREWHRVISSGFLHVDPWHLILNMISLYYCGPTLEYAFGMAWINNGGPLPYIALYFLSLVGGNLLGLVIHKNQPEYSAVGASGAISGLLFALAALVPNGEVRLFYFIPMPLWLFAILYVGYSLFGIRNNHGNIGHSAHLGGALVGMIITIFFFPALALENWLFLVLLLAPTAFALTIIIMNPGDQDMLVMFKRVFSGQWRKPQPRFVKEKGLEVNSKQSEIDRLLDKVSKRGIDSLTADEKRQLDEFSRGNRRSD